MASNAGYLAYFQNTSATDYRPVGFTDENNAVVGSIGYNTTSNVFSVGDSTGGVIHVVGGKVGIGTNAPAQTLHVYSGAINTIATFESTDDEAVIKIADNDTQGYITVKNNNISMGGTSGLNATNLNVVVSTGRVGIGVTSPGFKIDVVDQNPTDGIIGRLYNISASGLTGSKLWFAQNTVANWNIGQPAGTNAFVICNSTGSASERMRIDSSGKVGIGTTSPEYPLHISNADSAIYLVGSVQGRIILQDTGATSNSQAFDIVSKEDKLHFRRLNDSRGSVQATVMVLSGDKVGIGTGAPTNKFTVYGGSQYSLGYLDKTADIRG